MDIQIWSATSQFFLTQGVTVLTRPGFWQWQAKSVRDEQPSVVRADTKQLSWKCQLTIAIHGWQDGHTEQVGTLGSWALARPAATRATRAGENFILLVECV